MDVSVSLSQQQPQHQRNDDPQVNEAMTSTSEKNRGIDISQAISILSSRAKLGGNNDAFQSATPELKKLGQTLDLISSQAANEVESGADCQPCECMTMEFTKLDSNDTQTSQAAKSISTSDQNSKSRTPDSTLQPKTSKLAEELAKQSPSELLQTLFNLQKERVSAYGKFNSGLEVILQSGNLSHYPPLTTSITATFAVISSSIKEMQQLLSKHNSNDSKDIAQNIKKLQELEKEKLNLTAALHLEKIRERNERLELESQRDDSGNNDDGDDRVLQLLKEGVLKLKRNLNKCVEEINDVLEELRYAAFDLAD